MLRGNERKSVFQDSEDKQRFLEGLEAKQKDISFSVYAYCLMDNHVHLLLDMHNNDLSAVMRGIAVRYATFYNWKHSRVGHVFQDRFKSEAIEDQRYLLAVIRYIHNNPVKAGLVENPLDYTWSSYCGYLRPQGPSYLDTNFVLDIFSDNRSIAIKDFERFSLESDDSTFIDCEDAKSIRTVDEGRAYLDDYLSQAFDLEINQIKENKQLRKEIILHLRTHTGLSQRVIADLLGVDKSLVERVKLK
jgi:REP element-mobilizing transposase RayT